MGSWKREGIDGQLEEKGNYVSLPFSTSLSLTFSIILRHTIHISSLYCLLSFLFLTPFSLSHLSFLSIFFLYVPLFISIPLFLFLSLSLTLSPSLSFFISLYLPLSLSLSLSWAHRAYGFLRLIRPHYYYYYLSLILTNTQGQGYSVAIATNMLELQSVVKYILNWRVS